MKNPNPLEKEIEKQVVSYARGKSVLCYKFTSPAQRHVPDRIFFFGGRAFLIEFKRKGEKPTPAQSIEHNKLRAHGAVVHVVDSVEAGRRVVDLEVLT